MPVSTSRIREIRKQLQDIERDLDGDEQYGELADVVAEASDALDAAADEMGASRPVDDGPEVAPGVATDEPAEPDADDDPDAEDPVTGRKRKRRPMPPMPPSFKR